MVKLYAVYGKERGFIGHFVYLEKAQKFIEKMKKFDLGNDMKDDYYIAEEQDGNGKIKK